METQMEEARNDPQIGQKRLHLKNLLERVCVIEEREDYGVQSIRDVSSILGELNGFENNNHQIGDASETILDAKVINSASNVVLKCVNAVTSDTVEYNAHDCADKIMTLMDPDDPNDLTKEDLQKLHDIAKKMLCEVPPFGPIYGTYKFDLEPRPPKQKTKPDLQPQRERKETKLVKVVENADDSEVVEHRLNFMLDVLKKEYARNDNEPIGYYKYVIDTEDYGISVQNVFYTAFLVREGKVKIDVTDFGRIVLSPVDSKVLSSFKKQHQENTQLITKFSMSIWEKFKGGQGFLQHYKNKSK